MSIWRTLLDAWYVFSGANNESGPTYGSWSGIAGATACFVFVPAILTFYWHHTCHHSAACLRWGKYEAAGGIFRLCHHHHPDLQGVRPHGELIGRLHAEHQARAAGGEHEIHLDFSGADGALVNALKQMIRLRGTP